MSSWESKAKQESESGPEQRNTAEVLKPPFFIQEATLAKTLEQIRKVPPEKRRIIVYAGVHPNEGTDRLAERYAKEWADRYNVLVVCQPTTKTPHGIWKERAALTQPDGTMPRLPADLELNEDYYKKEFSLGEAQTIFIEFHGTPIDQWKDYHDKKREPKLEVILPIDQDLALRGIAEKLPDVKTEELQPDYKKQRLQTSNTVLIEYYYDGQPVEITDPDHQKVLEYERQHPHVIANKHDNGKEINIGPFASEENWDWQLNFGTEYLEQHTPTEEDKRRFDERFKAQFEALLEHISDRLPSR